MRAKNTPLRKIYVFRFLFRFDFRYTSMLHNGGEMVWCPEGMSDISLLNEVAKRCSETNISPPLNKSEKQDWWAEGESFSGQSRSDFVQLYAIWHIYLKIIKFCILYDMYRYIIICTNFIFKIRFDARVYKKYRVFS